MIQVAKNYTSDPVDEFLIKNPGMEFMTKDQQDVQFDDKLERP